jgi:peptidyl-Asp metalloendopeptidase
MRHTYVPSRSTPWLAALSFFAVACVGPYPARAQGNVLFERIPSTVVATADAAADPEQRRQLDTLRRSPTTASLELVRINVEALRAPTAAMALDAAPVEAVRRNVVERSSKDFSWFGEFPGIRGQANLVVQGGEVTGSVRDGANLYSIVPIGDGTHALIKVDPSRLPPDHPPDFRQVEKRANELTAPAAAQDAPANDTARTRIDVLVSYTGAAKAARRDIEAMIQLAVDAANTSYQNSGINIDLRLVGTSQVSYSEAGKSWETINSDQETGSDPSLMQVRQQRDALGADLVALIIDKSDFCGRADAILATANTAYAAVHYNCAVDNYSLAHELGHLQGARHDPAMDSDTRPFSYGHGYVNGMSWRTVMAYPQACRLCDTCTACPRLQYWSNPNVLYGGVPMGTAAVSNNASVLNQTRATIAGFR